MLAQKRVTMLFVKKAEVVYREVELKEYFTKSLFQVRGLHVFLFAEIF